MTGRQGPSVPWLRRGRRREADPPERATTGTCSTRRLLDFRDGDSHEKFLLGRLSFELKLEGE